MLLRTLDYEEQFHCLAGRCPHSCCIGWEVVLDEDHAQRYLTGDDPLSRRAAGRFDDLECAPLRSAHNQRNLIFIFVFQKRLRAFLEHFFTRGVVKMNGSCLPLRPLP